MECKDSKEMAEEDGRYRNRFDEKRRKQKKKLLTMLKRFRRKKIFQICLCPVSKLYKRQDTTVYETITKLHGRNGLKYRMGEKVDLQTSWWNNSHHRRRQRNTVWKIIKLTKK